MKKISSFLFLTVISIIALSFTHNKSIEQDIKVYICSAPRVPCYYKLPCRKFSEEVCTGNKIFKISLEKAKQMGKKECDCKDLK